MGLLLFLLGLFIGAFAGILAISLCNILKKSDEVNYTGWYKD